MFIFIVVMLIIGLVLIPDVALWGVSVFLAVWSIYGVCKILDWIGKILS